MRKMSVFNKTNGVLIVDTFQNVFQRRSSDVFKPDVPEFRDNPEVYASLSIQCHILYMLVGLLQKVGKSVSRESGQFSTCLRLPHPGGKRHYCGHICQQLDRLHEACCLQHCSRYPAILQGRIWKEVQGLNSDAGNFMLVTGRQRAALAAVSALSLPGMLT